MRVFCDLIEQANPLLNDRIERSFNSARHFTVLNYFSAHEGLWVESTGSHLLVYKEDDRLLYGSRLTEFLERATKVLGQLQPDWR